MHGSSPPNFSGDVKISEQNIWGGGGGWGGDLSKKLNLSGDLKYFGGTYEHSW